MVFKRIKKRLKEAQTKHRREREAERIYKRERELAYAQAEREKAWKLAEKGKRPKKKGVNITGVLETLGGSGDTPFTLESDPLGLFGSPRKKRKTRRTKRKKRKRK